MSDNTKPTWLFRRQAMLPFTLSGKSKLVAILVLFALIFAFLAEGILIERKPKEVVSCQFMQTAVGCLQNVGFEFVTKTDNMLISEVVTYPGSSLYIETTTAVVDLTASKALILGDGKEVFTFSLDPGSAMNFQIEPGTVVTVSKR